MYPELEHLTALVVKKIKELKGDARLDISNIRNGEALSIAANRPKIDMSDMRWHGGGDTVAAGTNITITSVGGKKVISATGGSSGVTNVTATAPLTSSGGTTPNISTSINTNRLLGRGTAGVGVIEEIILGTNLSLTGTTLNASGGGGSPAGSDTQIQFNDSSAFGASSEFTFNKTTKVLLVGNTVSGTVQSNKKLRLIGFGDSNDDGVEIIAGSGNNNRIDMFTTNTTGVTSGEIDIFTGTATGSGNQSGNINIFSSSATGDANSGFINISTGQISSGGGTSGDINIFTGNNTAGGDAGAVFINGGANSGGGSPGNVQIAGGNSLFSGQPAASVIINGGTAITGNSDGGNIKLNVGAKNGSGVDGNIGINGSDFGGGGAVIFIGNETTVPSSNPSGGGILYVQSGALKYRGSSGTVTTIAPA